MQRGVTVIRWDRGTHNTYHSQAAFAEVYARGDYEGERITVHPGQLGPMFAVEMIPAQVRLVPGKIQPEEEASEE